MNINFKKWAQKYSEETWPKDTEKHPIKYYDDIQRIFLEETSPYFENSSKVYRRRGFLLNEEFISICEWKTARQKNRYKSELNSQNIRRITTEIMSQNQDTEQHLKTLIKLNGVEVPVASAVLTAIFPKKYCIIDYRAWRSLNYKKNFKDYSNYSEFLDKYDRRTTIKSYIDYLEKIKKIAKKNRMSPRKIEMALWKFDEKEGKIV